MSYQNAVLEQTTGQAEPQTSAVSNSDTWGWGAWGWIALITLAAFAARLYHLDYRGLWTDEFHTLRPIQLPLKAMLLERLGAGHLPSYFILEKLWAHVAGTSDWALRFPSALAGALLVPAGVLLARPFLRKPVVFALAGFIALNGMAVWSSQEARMYSMLSVAATLAHHFYLQAVVRPRPRGWAAYFFWLIVAVSLQPVMLVVLLGHLSFSICMRKEYPAHARLVKRLVLGLLALFVPVGAVYLAFQQKAQLDLGMPNPFQLLRIVGRLVFGGEIRPSGLRPLASVALAVCLVAGWVGWRKRRLSPEDLAWQKVRPLLAFCAITSAIPLALFLVASGLFAHILGPERYLIPLLFPMSVLVWWGIVNFPRWARLVMAGVVLVLLFGGLYGQWSFKGTGGREAVQYLNKHAKSSDVVVVHHYAVMNLMLKHYGAQKLAAVALEDKLGPEQALSKLEEAMKGHERAWVFLYRDKDSPLAKGLKGQAAGFEVLEKREMLEAGLILVSRSEKAQNGQASH